ncbi:MAG: M28 family peptidase, partial [Gammaproteobacteria bacterium]|nr:M28 family peptidase [Gammaproteobacteria bacterium]
MTEKTLAARLESHVRMLAENIGERNVNRPDALAAAAAYIGNVWQEQGYRVTPQSYDVEGISCSNLEVSHRGIKHPEQILLIGAHYDTVSGSPGANDNGSGVAALLEIARLLKALETDCTVRFVAFVNEEPPFFFRRQMGSMVYARAARKRNDDIRLMISLEMLGSYSERPGSQRYPPLFRFFYPDRANYIAFVS